MNGRTAGTRQHLTSTPTNNTTLDSKNCAAAKLRKFLIRLAITPIHNAILFTSDPKVASLAARSALHKAVCSRRACCAPSASCTVYTCEGQELPKCYMTRVVAAQIAHSAGQTKHTTSVSLTSQSRCESGQVTPDTRSA